MQYSLDQLIYRNTLIDIILGHCDEGNALLYPCSLVDHSWWILCARHLHEGRRQIRLHSRLQDSDSLYTYLPLYPLRSIRNITAYLQPGHGENYADPFALERHITSSLHCIKQLNWKNVEALAIVMDFKGALFFHRHYISILQTSFPNIIRLDLQLRTETFNTLFLFICSVTQLEVLVLSCESLHDDHDTEPLWDLLLPLPLHTLHLNIVVFHGISSDNLCGWLRGQSPMNNLRSLSVMNCDGSTGPDEKVPTYIQLNNALTSLYLSFPADHIDPLTYLGDEDASEYVYNLSSLKSLESLSIHIPDSEVSASAPLPQLSVILMRLISTLKSITSTRLHKLNLISGENNLFPTTEWNSLDEALSSEPFLFVEKEIFVPIVDRDAADIGLVMQHAKQLFPRCRGQQRLSVTHLDRYGFSGVNLLEQSPL
ncbi:hypothetical protein WG66_010887 [Moniliophthora roreri]|nr:hypothetical protein WG66_010887 [Moniliophthora roreri]